MILKRLFGKQPEPVSRQWRTPAGQRIYAIGDIHGRRDLLDELLLMIGADNEARGPATTKLVFLGDLADRGLDSRGVIERLMQLSVAKESTIFLMGNHEELLIRMWQAERSVAATFNRVGGKETMLSYGISESDYDACDLDELMEQVRKMVPAAHIDFLKGFDNWYLAGDYLFVHAGIRPGYVIEDQDPVDLRWIRGEFTRSDVDHGVMVIHGHTITEEIDEQANRIGIDTGAFATGVLSAIGLEGTDRWFLATGGD
jgi:serine/threonine protein phosphatase 1